jgi:hypothetical protein
VETKRTGLGNHDLVSWVVEELVGVVAELSRVEHRERKFVVVGCQVKLG